MTTLTELKLTMKETGSIREFEFEIDGTPGHIIEMAGEFLSGYPKRLGHKENDEFETVAELAVIETFCETVSDYKILENNFDIRSAVDKIKMALDSIRNNMEQQEEENKQESVNPK